MPLIRAHKSKRRVHLRVRKSKRRAHRKGRSKLIGVTHCARLAPRTRKGRGTTRSGTGYLPRGLTEWDDPAEYQEVIHDLTAIYSSSDPVDTFLIEQMALEMLRSRRTARLEAETITVSSRPDTSSDSTSDRCTPMIDPLVMKEYAGPALDRLQRYASANLNRMLRCRRELKRMRRDEPGPGVTDTDIANADIVII
jgi:hypothetical protein